MARIITEESEVRRFLRRRYPLPRIKIALPTAYPYQIGFAALAGRLAKLPP